MDTSKNRKLLVGGAAAAFVLGAGAVAGAAVGAGPFERDDSGFDSARDLAERGAGSTPSTPDSTPGSLPDDSLPSGGVDGARTESVQFVDIPVGASNTYAAGSAGFVTVARDASGAVRVVAVAPALGWVFEIEPGDDLGEAEVDFRNGVSRVQFNAELEDGAVRIRVRTRGAAAGAGGTLPSGTLPDGDDSSGPGSSSSGPGGGGDDDSSGHESGGSDDSGFDDHGGDRSGHGGGSDDSGFDDHGGSSGHGGDDD